MRVGLALVAAACCGFAAGVFVVVLLLSEQPDYCPVCAEELRPSGICPHCD